MLQARSELERHRRQLAYEGAKRVPIRDGARAHLVLVFGGELAGRKAGDRRRLLRGQGREHQEDGGARETKHGRCLSERVGQMCARNKRVARERPLPAISRGAACIVYGPGLLL